MARVSTGFPPDWENIVRQIAVRIARKRFPGARVAPSSPQCVSRNDRGNSKDQARASREPRIKNVRRSQLADDLISEAVGHVWLGRESFDPTRGTFEAWSYKVIDNLAKDLMREQWYRSEIEGHLGHFFGEEDQEQHFDINEAKDPYSQEDLQAAIRRLDSLPQLPPEDIQTLEEKLSPKARVITLAVVPGKLWRKVPSVVWNQWLDAAGIDPPFPPEDPEEEGELDSITRRTEWLASAARMAPAAVRQHYYRSKRKLKNFERLAKYLSEDH